MTTIPTHFQPALHTLLASLATLSLVLASGGCVGTIDDEDVDPAGDGDTGTDLIIASGAVTNSSLYVSLSGSDSNPGTIDRPFRTVSKGMAATGPRSTLYLRGGTYVENVKVSPAKGTATSPIRFTAFAGERPVIQGLLWLSNPTYVTLDGVNVTWSSSNSSSDHMVKMSGGSNWSIKNCELWGAHSFAGLL